MSNSLHPQSLCVPLALGALLFASCGEESDEAARPDVLLVIIDTLRADALGSYGDELGSSPNLDLFAKESARFANCLSQAPNTATSHATLFTGLYPWTHRVANLTSMERGTPGLPPIYQTLAECFSDAGYQTAAFTDGGPLGHIWNLTQGFEVLKGRYEGVEAKVDAALSWLPERRPEDPVFMLLHTYQVHLPYVAPEEYVERFAGDYEGPLVLALVDIRAERLAGGESQPDGKRMFRDSAIFTDRDWKQLRALYQAEVAYTDHVLQRLLNETNSGGALAGAIVAITSDHGEAFGEHGDFGHHQLHRETLHVPLMLRLPDGLGAGMVIDEPVGLIDLFATLLEASALPLPAVNDSRSLIPLLRNERRAELPLFAETTEQLYSERVIPWLRSVRVGDLVYLSELSEPTNPKSERGQLFDSGSDSGELEDLLEGEVGASKNSAQRERARRLIEEHLFDAVGRREQLVGWEPESYMGQPDAELGRELKALGYTDD
ncbi:MAG: arylsulfatase A-like enzyme [Planctomycetota bacterium]|jgi:arylsulfatase A-like enzyme